MKIIYISDFFLEEFNGGAELSDNVVINFLENKRVDIKTVKSQNFDPTIHKADTFIISNFVGLSEENKHYLYNKNYIIIERDQKYVRNRNTVDYPCFIAQKSEVVNKDFYKNAKKVFCLTSKQMEIMNAHLEINNIESLGCTQFSEGQLGYLSSWIGQDKIDRYAIIPGKRQDKAIALCEREGFEYDILYKSSWELLIDRLCKYKGIVFFSHAFESCCRLLIESKILELKIITDNRNGCTYEDWFSKYKGQDLLKFISNKTHETLKRIYEEATK